MASGNMHNISTLLKRLEAVTSRLEDIVASPHALADLNTALRSTQDLLNPVDNSETSVQTSFAQTPVLAGDEEPVSRSIEEFDSFLDTSVDRYVQLSHQLGGPVANQAERVLESFRQQRKILVAATRTTKVDAAGFQKFIQPMTECAAEVVEIKESNRGSKLYNHLSCVADGIGLLGWVGLELRHHRHVDEYLSYAQFFGNKVLNEYKGKNSMDVEWVKSFYQIFHDLSNLVKEEFPYGISWKHKSSA